LVAVLWLALLGVLIRPGAALAQAEGPVYALRGMLSQAANQPYDTLLTALDGSTYGLVGQTPDVEAEIVLLRSQGKDDIVKVWGSRYVPAAEGGVPLIVVSAIQAETPFPAGTPAPPSGPTPVPTAVVPTIVVEAAVINVRSGPGTNYPPIGTLVAGQSCTIVARNRAATWWRVNCAGGLNGWVFGELVAVSGTANQVPVEEPAPPPTPAPPATYSGWKASFYTNRFIRGEPTVIQDLPAVNFNWGRGSPAPGIPADNWSAVFERTLDFGYGNYSISAVVDDGVHIKVDGAILAGSWNVGSARRLGGQRVLSGRHHFRIEYFEAEGDAQLVLNISLVANSVDWQAAYFNNRDLAGSPVFARGEPNGGGTPLGFYWGAGAPAPSINLDNWSGRWTGSFWFNGGDYRFHATADDGIRVYIDNIRVIDAWGVGAHVDLSNRFDSLSRGQHTVTVELFDLEGTAQLFVSWERVGGSGDSGGGSGGGSGGRDQ
jgi:uncharacterized protein YraI